MMRWRICFVMLSAAACGTAAGLPIAPPEARAQSLRDLDAAACRQASTEETPQAPIVNSIGMLLVPIQAGTFLMGSPQSDVGGVDGEGSVIPLEPNPTWRQLASGRPGLPFGRPTPLCARLS